MSESEIAARFIEARSLATDLGLQLEAMSHPGGTFTINGASWNSVITYGKLKQVETFLFAYQQGARAGVVEASSGKPTIRSAFVGNKETA